MPFRLLALLLALWTPVALGASSSVQKALSRRVEADEVIHQLTTGASVPQTVSRLRYLGVGSYAAEQLAMLLRRAVDARLRRNIVATLAGLEERSAEPVLVRLTQDGDSSVRMYAAQGLGRLRSRRADVLMPLLEDNSSGVRKAAARALGTTRNTKAARVLLGLAKTESDLEVRTAMLVAVGEVGDVKHAAGLKPFLESDSETTRFAAARGLCLLGHKDGFAFANKLLSSEDKYMRRQGLALFEGITAKRGRAALLPLLEGEDKALAAGAARILYQGGESKMLDWLVLASWNAKSTDEKLIYEQELEPLHLADDKRKAILRKAGMVK